MQQKGEEASEKIRFRRAEQACFALAECAPEERFIRLSSLPLDLRLLELGSGRPVLFVHGGGSCASLWSPLWRRWNTGRVIALDRPGCGLSAPFNYDGVALKRHVSVVLSETLDALSIDKATIVGSSFGGLWGLWFALAAPARVERLVLIGAPPLLLGGELPLMARLLRRRSFRWLSKVVESADAQGSRRLFARLGHTAVEPALLELSAAARGVPGSRDSFFSLMAATTAERRAARQLTAEELVRLDMPVTFIWGRNDPYGTLALAERSRALVPNASLEICGDGHVPWLDAPELCHGALVRALSR